MTKLKSHARLSAAAAAAAVLALAAATASIAADGATTSAKRAKVVKVKCPKRVLRGKRQVTCRLRGKLPRGARGPKGDRGPRGPRGHRGARGARGPAGSPGISGYEVVSRAFADVFVVNSGGQRGLSEVRTVACPGAKRVLGGGADLGTIEAQNGQQRQVTVSLSAPNGTGTGWSVQLFNNSTTVDTSIDLRVYAICANVG